MAAAIVVREGLHPPTDPQNCGSPVAMISAAACVASGTGVPVASNTTTSVPVGTDPTKVDVESVVTSAVVAAVGGTEVSVEAGAGVPAGATEVSEGGTEVSAGAAEVPSGAVEVSAAAGACVSFEAGADGLDEDDVSPLEAGAAGAAGVLSSARTTIGWTALTTSTNSVRLLNNII